MSNLLEEQLKGLIGGISAVLLKEPANRLADRLSEFIRIDAFLRSYQGGRLRGADSLPDGFKQFQRGVKGNEVTVSQISSMFDEFGRRVATLGDRLASSLTNEFVRLDTWKRICEAMEIDASDDLTEAADILISIESQTGTVPIDEARGTAESLWNSFREVSKKIIEKMETALDSDIVVVVERLLSGEKVRLLELEPGQLRKLMESPIAESVSLHMD